MKQSMIALVAAMSVNRVIGVDNQLPWRLPADLQRFKAITMNQTIVMGRRTYESIGRALPGRRNVIVSRQLLAVPGCEVVQNLDDLIGERDGDLYIIGGADIYRQTLPMADRIYLTEVKVELTGDAYFPVIDETAWEITEDTHRAADERNAYDMRFLVYQRRAAKT